MPASDKPPPLPSTALEPWALHVFFQAADGASAIKKVRQWRGKGCILMREKRE